MRTRLAALLALSLSGLGTMAAAQSTAINGTIEGVVKDTTGAVLPGATVTVTNVDMGAQRTLTAGSDGGFRAPLLPLGTYKVRVELPSFKSAERTGISLSAGQTAVLAFALEVGLTEDTVSVTGELPVAQPGKIDLGRTISESEIKNLPLVSRNPYNFAFLQANVTGFENQEFGVPRINANGTQMHTNYQIDGNTNTQKDRAGLRLLPVSEVVVREVKVITSGFAPEFGQTTGMVFNAVTPSGTNDMHGYVTYRYRRAGLTERPFFLAPTARKPDNNIDNFTATLGGPIVPDKWHYYVGYEFVDQDLRDATKVIQPSAVANAERLDLSPTAIPADGVIPTAQKVNFALAKTDYQLAPDHKLSVRYFFFKNRSPYNIPGGINTVDRATDFNDRMDSASVQLISSFGGSRLNELRVQFARRHQFRTASENSGTCPAVLVSGIAAFGCPLDGAQSAGFDFSQKIWQVSDNFTWIRGRHSFKAGVDLQFVSDDRVNTLRQIYTFPSVDAYLAAKAGTNPRSYTNFVQDLGDPTVSYSSGFHGVFIQDDFRISPSFKLLFGIRYDLFDVPDARPFAANPLSQSFEVDKNNFAPRVGFSWTLDKEAKTVVRASTGIMYEPPLLNLYEDAIQRNGDPRSPTTTLNPTSAGAPAFPATLANLPPGFALPVQSIVQVAGDFRTQWALMTNVQVERALTSDLAVSLGYVNSTGRSMPVLIDTNIIPSGRTLADGRPIYSTAVNASTRVNPAFNHTDVVMSTGEGSYNAFTLLLNKRMSHGVQMQASYTWAEGEDDAPLTGTYVVGSGDDRLSDPSNQGRDKGDVPFNQTHTFVMSSLLAPEVEGEGFWSRLADNNQLGVILTWNSGLPFNIRSNLDLNLDGVTSDRPLFTDRNTGRLGPVFNVDLRYSRFIPFGARFRGELFLEAKNIFNTGCSDSAEYATCHINVAGVNRVVTTNALGELAAPLPDPFAGTGGYQQRQIQLGVKLSF
jgi:Carboxypeptidase regulatory-like domain/TonB dependent receptor-like, beta-barrel